MSNDDVVEAMARGMMDAGCPVGIAHDLARAAAATASSFSIRVIPRAPDPAAA